MSKIYKKPVFTLLSTLLLFLLPLAAHSDIFEFRHVKGSRYRIISVVDQAVFINGFLSHRAETLNRISVEVVDVIDGKGLHNAVFQSSERIVFDSQAANQPPATGFHWTKEYTSVFKRDRLGRLEIDPQYFMPVVRNVPVFPDRQLNILDRWSAEGHEVHDFSRAFGIMEPYRIPFVAHYVYVGNREWKGTSYPAFSVTYRVASRPPPVPGRVFPTRIYGEFDQIIYWDHALGQAVAYEESFRLELDLSDRRRFQFRGTAHAEFVEAEEMDREQLITEIIEEINRLEIENVNVTAVDEGISLSLEDIRFFPDSARMLPGEEQKLEIIAEILKRYPDRDIMVSGHAALAGSREYLMNLSLERAKTIADFLLSRNVRTADRIVIRGYGAERPIADNSTEEGMRRNRRVEITILEN